MGFCYTSTTGLVPQWFKKYRALANGIAAGGTGFGGLIYTLSANAMIHNVGLAWAFRILAIIGFIVLAVCGFLIKDRNKKIGSVLNSFDWSLFKRVEYCLFLAWAWFSSMGYIVVLFSIADYVETVGYSPSQASIAAAIFSCESGVLREEYLGLTHTSIDRRFPARCRPFLRSVRKYQRHCILDTHLCFGCIFYLDIRG